MKQRTRKFLAGLLSFGMLLQAASPLSALAAEVSSFDTAELSSPMQRNSDEEAYTETNAEFVVTLKKGNTGDEIEAYVGPDTKKIDLGGYYKPAVEYTGGSYTITGSMGMYHDDSGYSDEVTIKGINGHAPNIAQRGQVNGKLFVEDVGDFTKVGAVTSRETINCSGDVRLETDGNTASSLDVKNTGSVTIIATGIATTISKTEIECSGPVFIQNTSTGAVSYHSLKITTDSDVTILGSCEKLVNGYDVVDGYAVDATAYITAKTLTMKNESGTVGKVSFTKPADSTADYVAYTSEDRTQKMDALPSGDEVNGGYLCVMPGAASYGFSINGTAITSDNVSSALPDGLTYNASTNELTATKDITGDLIIAADSTNSTLDVSLMSVSGKLSVGDRENPGAQNITIDGTVTGNTFVCVTGDITVNGTIASEQNGNDGQNRLDTTTGKITVTSDGAVWGQYANVLLKAVNGPATVSGNKPGEYLFVNGPTIWATEIEITNPDGKIPAITFVPQCAGYYYINKSTEPAERVSWVLGQDRISSEAVDSKLVISQTKYAALTITVTEADNTEKTYSIGPDMNGTYIHDVGIIVYYDSVADTYTLSGCFHGNVVLTGSDFDSQKPNVVLEHHNNDPIVSGDLTVTNVNNFEAKSELTEVASGKVIITADGDVSLRGLEFYETEVKAKSLTMDTNKSLGKVTYTTPNGTTYTPTEEEINNTSLKLDSSIIDKGNTNIPDDTDDAGGTASSDGGSAVGAVIAGAAIGSTVLFVGYEVVTDIILGNLLPAGADTPVNRGQLAWLIWSTKGAPEPESQPAFTDVSEPEMAKAAQWCVEQDIMDAKSDSTFNPGGWVPKFKVIETWNKAFPTQN